MVFSLVKIDISDTEPDEMAENIVILAENIAIIRAQLAKFILPDGRFYFDSFIAREGEFDPGPLSNPYFPLGNVIRLRDTAVGIFDGTDVGFEAANAGAASGDVILLPAKTFASTITITTGLKIVGWSRYTSILTGQITGAAGSSIENLTINRTANSGDTLKGVVGPASGTFYIHSCDVKSNQSGAGDARGISAETNGTTVEAWNSYIYGNSGSGTGNGTWRDTGTTAVIAIFGGRVFGNTNPCNE